MKECRNVPLKNYVILSCILILSIIITIYFYMWYGEFTENKINKPIMNQYLSIINYNELDDYLVENKDVFIYISILENKSKKFEKKFAEIINKYSLDKSILYLDLTEEQKNNKLFNNIKNKYNIQNLPSIIVFKNGVVDDVYSIDEHDYDLELLVSYLRIKGVIYD